MLPTEGVLIRCQGPDDQSSVRSVNESAFERRDEADLVDRVRSEGALILSLVAEVRKQVVGHVLFSRMWIDNGDGSIAAVALAPVAVLPSHQRQGIGAKLIATGLNLLRERGEQTVFVLGHPDYYSRFGFSTELARGLEAPFPRHAYMAVELSVNALRGARGKVRYPPAFGL